MESVIAAPWAIKAKKGAIVVVPKCDVPFWSHPVTLLSVELTDFPHVDLYSPREHTVQ
jgi:hypothetical protein